VAIAEIDLMDAASSYPEKVWVWFSKSVFKMVDRTGRRNGPVHCRMDVKLARNKVRVQH